MEGIEAGVLNISGSVWVLPIVFLLNMIDGFFPPPPSQAIVIALAAFAAAGRPAPDAFALFLVAAAASWAGDQCAYALGMRVDVTKLRIYRSARAVKVFDEIDRTFGKRADSLVFGGRFFPLGRVTVNMVAGSVGYNYRRFVVMTVGAGLIWSAYCVGIGALAAHAVGGSPLINAVIGILVGILVSALIGYVANRWLQAVSRRRLPRDGKFSAAHQGEGATRRSQRDEEEPHAALEVNGVAGHGGSRSNRSNVDKPAGEAK